MTKEEASNILNDFDVNFEGHTAEEVAEAFDVAFRALEQEPCDDWYDVPSDEMTLEQARQAVKDLRKKLAEYLEQQPCAEAKEEIWKDIPEFEGVYEASNMGRIRSVSRIVRSGKGNAIDDSQAESEEEE